LLDGVHMQGKKSKEQAGGEAKKEAAKEEELPEVKQLPPWFKDISDAKDVRIHPWVSKLPISTICEGRCLDPPSGARSGRPAH
jgi:hypothetical protein